MESEKRDRERGKDPDRFVEMVSGPNLEYSWIAELKAGPVPQGLDGGRVVSFSLVKDNDAARAEAPDITDQNKYLERLNSLPPRVIQIARFEDGKLTRFEDDPHAAAIIDEIRDLSSGKDREAGGAPEKSALDPAKKRAIEKAARHERGRGDEDREADRDR